MAGALFTQIDRMVRVARDLLRPTLHHTHDEAIAAWHVGPSRRVPSVFTPYQVLRHVDRTLDDEFAFRQTAGRENHRAGRCLGA